MVAAKWGSATPSALRKGPAAVRRTPVAKRRLGALLALEPLCKGGLRPPRALIAEELALRAVALCAAERAGFEPAVGF